jgi:carboxymethylenebutenolidase
MCFDHDSRPPIAPIAGGALDAQLLTLTAEDGNAFSAYRVRAAEPTGAGIVICPDVRGLHPYYQALAERFAEHGVDAITFDFFGRTAGLGVRGADFEYMPHVMATTFAGLTADLRAAAADLRSQDGGPADLFTVGFCFGGRFAFLSSTVGLDLAGSIGFYGPPTGAARNDMPPPVEMVGEMANPILGLFGGADPGITADAIEAFEQALTAGGVEHRIVVAEGAPHSYFDRKFEEFAEASAQAWDEVLAFIRSHQAG